MEKRVSFQENWRQTHLRSLQNYYRNSPYFAFYEESLKSYYQKDHEYLIEWLKASIVLSFDCIGVSKPLLLTESYANTERAQDDWRYSFSGKVETLTQISTAEYTQVYGAFTPNLSVLDLIFSAGPESILIINRGIINEKP